MSLNRFSQILTQDLSRSGSRAMLHAIGVGKQDLSKPQIGIGSVNFDSNPCNSKLYLLSEKIACEAKELDMIPFKFSTIGVSDGITMGTEGMKYSLPSRELIADSFETIVNAHYYDAFISIPNCDKNLPAVAMSMFRINKPSLIVYGGSMKPNYYKGKNLDILSSFEGYGSFLKKEISKNEYEEILLNSCHKKCGSCSGMYTANTMATIFEVMGITLPNSSSNPHLSIDKFKECKSATNTLLNLIKKNLKPLDIVKRENFLNGIKMLMLTGGSTNAVIHLLALAKEANIDIKLKDFTKYSDLQVLLDLKPHGKHHMYNVYQTGGMTRFIKYLIQHNLLNGNVLTVTGKTLYENVEESEDTILDGVFRTISNPVTTSSHIKILYGNLAPNGCVLKTNSNRLYQFKGNLRVFNTEKDFITSLTLGHINRDHIILIRYQGESIGCPEMLSPTSALIGYFKHNPPPLLTDGRFSGGSHGVLIAHLPDAYKKDSITRILRDNDKIIINFYLYKIDVELCDEEIKSRFKNTPIKHPTIKNGYLKKYNKLVGDIDTGYSSNV